MAGVSLVARIEDAQLRSQLAKLAGQPKKALAPIGMALVRNVLDRFHAGAGPGGAAWAPLHPMYAPIKRGPGILRASGLMMGSIHYELRRDEVRVGTNRIQARIHQFGGVIRPKARMASGFSLVSKVTIPARPFLGLDARDRQDIRDELEALLSRP